MHVYKFNPESTYEEPSVTMDYVSKQYQIRGSQLHNLQMYGCVRSLGYCFDFREDLKKYVGKTSNGDLFEHYAPNKTLLKKSMIGGYVYALEVPHQNA